MNEDTRLGVWKIEETEEFFKGNVPVHREVTHPHKRLQHLAGRFLLQYLFPDFPYELIAIADTRKPYLPNEQYHFSISHCGDYAAAIVSRSGRVGIDVEEPKPRIIQVGPKFTSLEELKRLTKREPSTLMTDPELLTLVWSVKESVFKWYGLGGVDFRDDIRLLERDENGQEIGCLFQKLNMELRVGYEVLDGVVCSWIIS